MKRQDTSKIIIAAFLALTMVFSIFAYFFTGPVSDREQTSDTQQNKYNPEFWIVRQPFDSISDALNLTPVGAEYASYVDLESMTPQMAKVARQEFNLIKEVDTIYKSNTTKMYYADLRKDKNESFLLLSTMYPEKNDFEYFTRPDFDIPILQRTDLNGFFNVMGTPVILAPPQTAIDTLNIIYSLNRTNTSYDKYEGLLDKAPHAPIQIVNSSVGFAKQYYMGIRTINGTYERTTVYLSANSSTLMKLDNRKANMTQNGFTQYNITKSGDYTIVKIAAPDMDRVLSEENS